MKKTLLLMTLIFGLLLSGCNLPNNNVDPNILYTIAASTFQAQQNAIASLTPPTETPTPTALPTETPLPSDTPTATPQPSPTPVTYEKGSTIQALVLYYYDILNNRNEDPYYQWESTVNVPSIEFEQQVRTLYELGYQSIGASKLVDVIRNGGELPVRPVIFTFDSTEPGQYINAWPILAKYGFMGNLMVQYNHIDAKNSLSSDQIKQMMADGWEIGSAGYYGNGMTDTGTMGQEIGQSKSAIEKLLETTVSVFAYPDGYIDPESQMIRRASEYGYLGAFAGNLRKTEYSLENLYYMPRFLIEKNMNYADFFAILPWQEGYVSQETMEWSLPTATLDPALIEQTKVAAEAEMIVNSQIVNTPEAAADTVPAS